MNLDDFVTTPSSEKFLINVIADVTCPFCYFGKRRLDMAIKQQGLNDYDVFWRPGIIDLNLPREGVAREPYLEKKLGGRHMLTEYYNQFSRFGLEIGITFNFHKILVQPNTLDAHRLVRWAHRINKQHETVERLFTMFFSEGIDIGNRAVLIDLARQIGLDSLEVRHMFEDGTAVDKVMEDYELGLKNGVKILPFYILDHQIVVPGPQNVDVLSDAIEKAMSLKTPAGAVGW